MRKFGSLLSLLPCFFIASCSSETKLYCKNNDKPPYNNAIYRDIDLFGLKGIDKISCDSAKKSKVFICFMHHENGLLKGVAIKPFYNKKYSYIWRIHNAGPPLFVSHLLNPNDPGGRNFDTVIVSNDSLFAIHRTFKLHNSGSELFEKYYVWEKKSPHQIYYYHYTSKPDKQLNLNNVRDNAQLVRQISYRIENGNIYSERINYEGPAVDTTKKTEPFENFFLQIFLRSL